MPSFDSPSILGSLLDREAGIFRVGPFGIHVPAARSYEPGTNTLATTWNTPEGWILSATRSPWVRETARTRSRPTRAHRQTTTPTTCWYAACSASREASSRAHLRARVRLADEPAEVVTVEGDRHVADATGAEQTVRLQNRHGPRHRGRHGPGAAHPDEGEQAYCSLSWADRLVSPESVDQANARLAATTSFWRARLGRAFLPDHRFRDPVQRSALTIKG